MAIAHYPPPPRQTANPSPVRLAQSIRRTSSIDVAWPDGPGGNRRFIGRVRDLRTGQAGDAGEVLAFAEMQVTMDEAKTIHAISADPAPARLQELVGQRAGNHFRLMIRETLPELLEEAAPLYLALDDLSGTSLVSGWAWAQWDPNWAQKMRDDMPGELRDKMLADRAGVCWGLQIGNSGLDMDREPDDLGSTDAGELRNPADPQGWHEFPVGNGASFRRARRIDVTQGDDGLLHIDSAFQDSALTPSGGRAAIHEYRLVATAKADTLELLTLEPEARILPFPECPGAIHNTQRLIGSNLAEMRATVLAQLRGPEGCTHLNDALRALAEVPRLAMHLERQPA